MSENTERKSTEECLDTLEGKVNSPMPRGRKILRATGIGALYALGGAAALDSGLALVAAGGLGGYLSYKRDTEQRDWDLLWPGFALVGGGALGENLGDVVGYATAALATWGVWNWVNKDSKISAEEMGAKARYATEKVKGTAKGAIDGFQKGYSNE